MKIRTYEELTRMEFVPGKEATDANGNKFIHSLVFYHRGEKRSICYFAIYRGGEGKDAIYELTKASEEVPPKNNSLSIEDFTKLESGLPRFRKEDESLNFLLDL